MARRTSNRAFTLIELLVVVAIIALLISILLPALSKAKENGRRAVCLSNLHHLGQAFQQYLHDYNDILPAAAEMPSLTSVDPASDDYFPPITDFLKPYAKNLELFRCPSDMPGRIKRESSDPKKNTMSFWETEGTSFKYAILPSDAASGAEKVGKRGFVQVADDVIRIGPDDMPEYAHPWHHSGMSTSDAYLLTEYESYHGKRGNAKIRNTLYADFHVEEFLLEIREPNRP
jgi:prepilin-type N-terminal cleavage/methylation domain-containing protein